MIIHHVCCIALMCSFCVCRWLFPLGRRMFRHWIGWHRWRAISSSEVPGKQTPLFISMRSHSLAPALFYCIRTTTFQPLHAAVAEPLSSAWPVIATVNRWNPLAWVGVVLALMCLLIHAFLSCLLLLRVESGLIHRGWIRGVWTCPTVCELRVWTRFVKRCRWEAM